jgi:hypothetical protein
MRVYGRWLSRSRSSKSLGTSERKIRAQHHSALANATVIAIASGAPVLEASSCVPRVRDGGFYLALLEPRRGGGRPGGGVQEEYVNRVSTRRFDDVQSRLELLRTVQVVLTPGTTSESARYTGDSSPDLSASFSLITAC